MKLDFANQLKNVKETSKESVESADGLYIKLVETQQELKQKNEVLDELEKEFNRMQENEEAYRD